MPTEIVLTKKIPKNPIFVDGFPSNGFVGMIVAKHLVTELKLKQVGYVTSDKVQGIAIIHKEVPMHPMRIYAGGNLVVLLSELVVPHQFIPEFAAPLMDFFSEHNPSKVILLSGIPPKGTEEEEVKFATAPGAKTFDFLKTGRTEQYDIMGVASNKEMRKQISDYHVSSVSQGMLTGMNADLVLYCIDKKIPAVSLMVETHYVIDAYAAAALLSIVSKLIEKEVETKQLVTESQIIENTLKEISSQMKRQKEHEESTLSTSPPMYV